MPWSGGDCPVNPDTFVDVLIRGLSMGFYFVQAKDLRWCHIDGERPGVGASDIIAYRLSAKRMTPIEAAETLRKHNEYRRDNSDNPSPMQDPRLIGEAIDVAVEYIESRERV